MENFENEVNQIVHNNEQTFRFPWIKNLEENFDHLDGFEPPILDETWGLHENHENSAKPSFDERFLSELKSK